MEFELQLRHYYTQSNLNSVQRDPKKVFQWEIPKITIVYYQHCRISIAHFKRNQVELFAALFLGSLVPLMHRLCLL